MYFSNNPCSPTSGRRVFSRLTVVLVSFLYFNSALATKPNPEVPELTVFLAAKIITMDSATPLATAVATADGKIVSVGSLKDLEPWFKNRKVTIDERFKDKVLMPGFIEPHVHPSLPAIVTQFPFLAPDDWSLPTGEFPGAKSNAEYISKLKTLVSEYVASDTYNESIPFVTWGYHSLWHGDIYRAELDTLFPTQPVVLWQRSFHEIILNTAALTLLGIDENTVAASAGSDFKKGHYWEGGAQAILPKLNFILEPQRYAQGMQNFVKMLHQGGVTSAMDMGTGIFGSVPNEVAMIKQVLDQPSVATRMVLTPISTFFVSQEIAPTDALTMVREWEQQYSSTTPNSKVVFDKHFKLMLDGAIFSGLAQFEYPGYIDGHHGEWLVPLEKSYEFARVFWDEGYQIHAHTNGDKSTNALLKIVSKLQAKKPRTDHRTTLEHFAYATTEQLRNLDAMGIAISANPYYQYILSDLYAEKWLGEDRARNMVPLGTAAGLNIPIGLHSDSPMAPLSPLTLAWAAVNRTTINGNQNNRKQKLTVDQAMRAITIDAAWLMRWEHKVGSISAGKLADFVVLDKDPYQVKPSKIKDIKVLGTVFEGNYHPVSEQPRYTTEQK